METYLLDKAFLKRLDQMQNKKIYAKIIALNNKEEPVEQITGNITSGSINIDGTAAIRRTCNLSIITQIDDTTLTDELWVYKTRFKLLIGVENTIEPSYPDIVWFKQGTYVITSFSASTSTTSISISISGQDKMCLLNGSVAGKLPAQVDFGTIETISDSGEVIIEKIDVKTIIQNAIRVYGNERDGNIIINDLDTNGFELWKYLGDTPMYYIIRKNDLKVLNMTLDGNNKVSVDGNLIPLSNFGEQYKFYSFNTLDQDYNVGATEISYAGSNAYVVKIEYGESAGYYPIPLVYNSDLILNAGEAVTNMLDKIKAMLGNFEYFYDLDGRFVFQKENTYTQELFSPISGDIVSPIMEEAIYSYKFEDNSMITNLSRSPNISSLKNDYTVFGKRADSEVPIHGRCAIAKKPETYVGYSGEKYFVKNTKENFIFDQKLSDFKKVSGEGKISYSSSSNKLVLSGQVNVRCTTKQFDCTEYNAIIVVNISNSIDSKPFLTISVDGKTTRMNGTGLQSYVVSNLTKQTDIRIVSEQPNNKVTIERIQFQGYKEYQPFDWRELIYQMGQDYNKYRTKPDFFQKIAENNPQYANGITGYEPYYVDLLGFWRDLYDPNGDPEFYYDSGTDVYWNKQIHTDPGALNFWFDFYDINSQMQEYSTNKIGQRTEVVNDTSLNSIYHKETPEVWFSVNGEVNAAADATKTAYTPLHITPAMKNLFAKSSQGLSILDKINSLFSTGIGRAEGLNISAVPIYYLEPNTRIFVNGGDYIVSRISYQFGHNGTMSLTTSKVLDVIN